MIAGQFLLAANTLTEVYRAADTGANELWVEVFVCNQDGGQWSTLDIAVTRGTEVPEAKHYMYRGYSMRPNETRHPRLLLRDGDVVIVRATTARISVTVSAEEIVTPRVMADLRDRVTERLNDLTEEVQRIAEVVQEGVSV